VILEYGILALLTTLRSCNSKIPDDGQSPQNQVILEYGILKLLATLRSCSSRYTSLRNTTNVPDDDQLMLKTCTTKIYQRQVCRDDIVMDSTNYTTEKESHFTRDHWEFGLCTSSVILKNKTFRQLELFPSSAKWWETGSPLKPLERANLNH
jgi:hypothetical protein